MLLIDRWWHTSTPLYRRCISDAAGAWPSRRPEDWDLEARMGALGARLVYCAELVSCHRDHDDDSHRDDADQEAIFNEILALLFPNEPGE